MTLQWHCAPLQARLITDVATAIRTRCCQIVRIAACPFATLLSDMRDKVNGGLQRLCPAFEFIEACSGMSASCILLPEIKIYILCRKVCTHPELIRV